MSGTRRRSRWGAVGGGGCGLIVVGALAWCISALSPPAIHIPNPRLPNPNGFDTLLTAASQELERGKVDDAATGQSRSGAMTSLAEKRRLAAENAPAIATIRAALDQQYCNPPIRSPYALVPYYAQFRSLARLSLLDCDVHEAAADHRGAARSALDCIAIGAQVPRGAPVIGGLVGISCQAMGRKAARPLVPELSPSEAREAAQRLAKIERAQPTLAETLQEEEWTGQASLLDTFRRRPQRSAAGQPGLQIAPSVFYLVYSKQRIMSDYTRYMEAQIRQSRGTYAPGRRAVPSPPDPIAATMATNTDLIEITWLDNVVQNRLLELELALRAYRAEHHSYPDSLAPLAPAYVAAMPSDPFTAGQPFRYRKTGSAFVLYSVGPDGVDNGGAPIDNGPSQNGSVSARLRATPGSKGDIVSGVNR